jgi:hypothetical protein
MCWLAMSGSYRQVPCESWNSVNSEIWDKSVFGEPLPKVKAERMEVHVFINGWEDGNHNDIRPEHHFSDHAGLRMRRGLIDEAVTDVVPRRSVCIRLDRRQDLQISDAPNRRAASVVDDRAKQAGILRIGQKPPNHTDLLACWMISIGVHAFFFSGKFSTTSNLNFPCSGCLSTLGRD